MKKIVKMLKYSDDKGHCYFGFSHKTLKSFINKNEKIKTAMFTGEESIIIAEMYKVERGIYRYLNYENL